MEGVQDGVCFQGLGHWLRELLSKKGLGRRRGSNHHLVTADFFKCYATAASLDSLPCAFGSHCSGTTRKVVYLVRHAEAVHNVEEKRVRAQSLLLNISAKEAADAREEVLRRSNYRDASLSSDGQQQVRSAAQEFRNLLEMTHYPMPGVVLTSPLERTLQTSNLLFPDHPDIRAIEFLREKRTGRPCDERKPVATVIPSFPHVDFSHVQEADSQGSDGFCYREELREDDKVVGLRAAKLLDMLRAQTCDAVAVVTHKAFLRALSKGPWARVLDLEDRSLSAEFGNAEVRICEVCWDENGMPLVQVRSMRDAIWRPSMVIDRKSVLRRQPTTKSLCGCAPYGGGLHLTVSCSTQEDSAVAARQAWMDMRERLGREPTFAFIFCHSSVDSSEVVNVLKPLAGSAVVIGGSSAHGVLAGTCHGLGRVGIMGLCGLAHRCGVGFAKGASGLRAKAAATAAASKAAASAARQAVHGTRKGPPDLVFIMTAPGNEEAILEGIQDLWGHVPVLGGSASDESVITSFGQRESWWQLYGSAEGWGSHTDGIVVAAFWLHSDAHVKLNLLNCYAPTGRRGNITRAGGRVLAEIDHRPAAEVLHEWSDEALSKEEGFIALDAALFPMALSRRGSELRLVQAKAVLACGHVECFAHVTPGEVQLLRSKASDLPGALAAVARAAVERAQMEFAVKGGIINFCAGTPTPIEDRKILQDALSKELPTFLCFFSFGEMGMVGGTAQFGNLMVSMALFG